jgi:hypothetical protein
VVVGQAVRALEGRFDSCRVVRRLDNGVGVDTEEQGVPVSVCRGRTEAWATLWPRLRHLD